MTPSQGLERKELTNIWTLHGFYTTRWEGIVATSAHLWEDILLDDQYTRSCLRVDSLFHCELLSGNVMVPG